jgi:hypothetical protein
MKRQPVFRSYIPICGKYPFCCASFVKGPAILLFASLLSVLSLAQTVPFEKLSPRQTIMLGDVVTEQLGGHFARNPVQAISQAHGVWAVLFSSSIGKSVVTGDAHNQPHAFSVAVDIEQIAVDQDRRVHLAHRYLRPSDKRTVSVVDLAGNSVSEYLVPAGFVHPFLTGSGIVWKSQDALVGPSKFLPILQLNGLSDVNDSPNELEFVGTLTGGGYFTFGSGSEVITLHAPDGSVWSSYPAPLDAAYAAIGSPVPKPGPETEVVRVMWASTGSNGLLYVALSGLPAAGPVYVAVIEARSGTLQKVLRAELPKFKDEISPANPDGVMFPGRGVVDDQVMMIADQQKAVLAIY